MTSQDHGPHLPSETDLQEGEADHLDDVTKLGAFKPIEIGAIDLEAVAASSGKKSAKMIAKEERRS
jgi:hypothetical protein